MSRNLRLPIAPHEPTIRTPVDGTPRVNILFLHNYYQQAGGEDLAFANEAALFESYGHKVVKFSVHNDRVRDMGLVSLAKATLWNSSIYEEIRELIRKENIEICHFHNTFPLISPAAYYAANRENVPVVQSLHNYRLICPAHSFYRNGKVCEDCLGKTVPWPAVLHSCYRDDMPATTAVASMLTLHRALGTWKNRVQVYIALTEFSRDKFVEAGLPADRIVVKRNFLQEDPGKGAGDGAFALFIGRLVQEKGIKTLLAAWERIGTRLPLKIIGGGPLSDFVSERAAAVPGVTRLGRVSDQELDQLLGAASVLVFPSEWYEGLPRTIIEAYAKGTPVICGKLGSQIDAVIPGHTGLHFKAGDSQDLVDKVNWVIDHPEELRGMRHNARLHFERTYMAASNYSELLRIYERAIGLYETKGNASELQNAIAD
jgi:glycosyltransferase involved in cell wall biosynthesis